MRSVRIVGRGAVALIGVGIPGPSQTQPVTELAVNRMEARGL